MYVSDKLIDKFRQLHYGNRCGVVCHKCPPAKATSDHGFAQLEIWFHGPYQRTVATRDATDARKVRARKVDPERKPADIELRPPEAQHAYRYQIHRRPALPATAGTQQPA